MPSPSSQNILVTKEGIPKIADFGLAKIVDSQTFLKVRPRIAYLQHAVQSPFLDYVRDTCVPRPRGIRWNARRLFGEGG